MKKIKKKIFNHILFGSRNFEKKEKKKKKKKQKKKNKKKKNSQ